MSYFGELLHNAAWIHGNQLRKGQVADEVAAEIARSIGPTDDEIRHLVRSVAQATVERITDELRDQELGFAAQNLDAAKHLIAGEMTEDVMACADEDPESEVHAMRRMRP